MPNDLAAESLVFSAGGADSEARDNEGSVQNNGGREYLRRVLGGLGPEVKIEKQVFLPTFGSGRARQPKSRFGLRLKLDLFCSRRESAHRLWSTSTAIQDSRTTLVY